jgi:hypothetical protein
MRVDGNAVAILDKLVQTALLALADRVNFLVPAGSEVYGLRFQMDDSDTGTALLFSVGYRPRSSSSSLAANATYFAAAGQTTGQAGGSLLCAFKPIKFEEDVYITLTVGAASAGIAGNPEIHMIAEVNQVGAK